MRKNIGIRLLSLATAVLMLFGMLPTAVFAGMNYSEMEKVNTVVTAGTELLKALTQGDTVTARFQLPSAAPEVHSLFLVDVNATDEDPIFLYFSEDAVTINPSGVAITLEGLYDTAFDGVTGMPFMGEAVPAGEYYFVVWDDSVDEYGTEYASNRTYVVEEGGGGGGETTIVDVEWSSAELTVSPPIARQTADYSFVLKPDTHMTFAANTELSFAAGNVDFTNATLAGTNLSLAGKGKGMFKLKFTAQTDIMAADGLAFTLSGVINPLMPGSVSANTSIFVSTVESGDDKTVYRNTENKATNTVRIGIPTISVAYKDGLKTYSPFYTITVEGDSYPRYYGYTTDAKTFRLSGNDYGKKLTVGFYDRSSTYDAIFSQSVEIPAAGVVNTAKRTANAAGVYNIVLMDDNGNILDESRFYYYFNDNDSYCEKKNGGLFLPGGTAGLTVEVEAGYESGVGDLYYLDRARIKTVGSTVEVIIPGIRTVSLSGRVTTPDGTPVPDAQICAVQVVNGTDKANYALSDENGDYTVLNLLGDTPVLSLTASSVSAPASVSRSNVDIAGGNVNITLVPYGTMIYITLPQGAGVSSVYVRKNGAAVTHSRVSSGEKLWILAVEKCTAWDSVTVTVKDVEKAVEIGANGVGHAEYTESDLEVYGSVMVNAKTTSQKAKAKVYLFSPDASYLLRLRQGYCRTAYNSLCRYHAGLCKQPCLL